MAIEETLWDYEQVARRLGLFKDTEKTTADVEQVKRLVREGRIKSLSMSDRRIMFDPQDIEDYIKRLKGEQVKPRINTDNTNTDDDLAKINADIETMEKSKVLHQKTLEYNALRANFKTAEEYQQALDNLKTAEELFKETTAELTDWDTTLKAREIAIKDKEDSIETACNDKLTECEDNCNKMIEDTKKECEQMVAHRKVELNKQEMSEDEDMEWAFNEFYKIIYAMNEWDFSDYSQTLRGRLEFIIDNFNASPATLKDLSGDFRYCVNIVNNLMEYTQTLKRNAHQFVELRNELGRILVGIQVRLHLDDERRGNKQLPALPSD
jgi:hypothetical protein